MDKLCQKSINNSIANSARLKASDSFEKNNKYEDYSRRIESSQQYKNQIIEPDNMIYKINHPQKDETLERNPNNLDILMQKLKGEILDISKNIKANDNRVKSIMKNASQGYNTNILPERGFTHLSKHEISTNPLNFFNEEKNHFLKIKEKDEKIAEMEEEIKYLTDKKESLEKIIISVEKKLDSKKNSEAELTENSKQYQIQYESARSELAHVSQINAELMKRIQSLKKDIENKDKLIQELKNEISGKKQKPALANPNASSSMINRDYETKIEKFNVIIKEKDDIINRQQEELKDNFKEYKSDLDRINKVRSEIEAKLVTQIEYCHKLQNDIKDMQKSIQYDSKQYNAEIDSLNEKLELITKNEANEKEIEMLSCKIASQDTLINQLTQEKTLLKNKKAKAVTLLEKREKEIASLKKIIEETMNEKASDQLRENLLKENEKLKEEFHNNANTAAAQEKIVNDLEIKIKDYEKKIAEQNTELQSQSNLFNKEAQGLKKTIAEVSSKNLFYEDHFQELKDTLSENESVINELKKINKQNEEKINDFTSQLQAKQDKVKELYSKIQKYQVEIKDYKAKLTQNEKLTIEATDYEIKLTNLTGKITQLECANEEALGKINELTKQISVNVSEINDLKNKLSKSEDLKNETVQRCNEQAKKIIANETEINDLKEKLAQSEKLTNEYIQKSNEQDKKITVYEAEINDIKSLFSQNEGLKNDTLQKSNKAAKIIQDYSEEIKDLKGKLSKAEELKNEIILKNNELTKKILDSSTEMKGLKGKLMQANDVNNEITKKNNDITQMLQDKLAEIQNLQRKINQCESLNKDYVQKNNEQLTTIKDHEVVIKELQGKINQVECLKNSSIQKIKEQEQKITESEAEINVLKGEFLTETQKVNELKKQILEYEANINELKLKNGKLVSIETEINKKLKELNENNMANQKEIKNLKDKISQNELLNNEMTNQLNNQKKKINDLEAENKDLKSQVSQNERLKNETIEQSKDQTDKIIEYESQLTQLNTKINEQKQKLIDSETAEKEISIKYQQLITSMTESSDKNHMYSETIKSLTAKINEQEQNLKRKIEESEQFKKISHNADSDLRKEIQEKDNALLNANKSLAIKDEEIRKSREELKEEKQALTNQITQYQTQIQSKEDEVKSLSNVNAKLNEEVTKARDKLSVADSTFKKDDYYISTINQLRNDLEQSKLLIAKYENNMSNDLNNALLEAQNTLNIVITENEAIKEELTKSNQEKLLLREMSIDIQLKLDDIQKENEIDKKTILQLSDQIKSLNSTLKEKEEEMKVLGASNENLRESVEVLKKKKEDDSGVTIKKVKTGIDYDEDEITNLKLQADSLKEIIQIKDETIRELTQELENYKNEVDNAMKGEEVFDKSSVNSGGQTDELLNDPKILAEKCDIYKRKSADIKQQNVLLNQQLLLLKAEIKNYQTKNEQLFNFNGRITDYEQFKAYVFLALENYKPKKKEQEEAIKKIKEHLSANDEQNKLSSQKKGFFSNLFTTNKKK